MCFGNLKGLSNEMDLAFDVMNGQFLALIVVAVSFRLFKCSNDFLNKKCISHVSVSLHRLTNVTGVYLSRFLASYWSTGFRTFLQVSAWPEDGANFMLMTKENNKFSANHS